MIVLKITRRTALHALAAVALEHLLLHRIGDVPAGGRNLAVPLPQPCVVGVHHQVVDAPGMLSPRKPAVKGTASRPRPCASLRADPGQRASPARSGTCREDGGEVGPSYRSGWPAGAAAAARPRRLVNGVEDDSCDGRVGVGLVHA